jgi:protein-tyrosine phosphatase
MPNILFVCSANRFRSVIAAGFFKSLVRDLGLPGDWTVGSAGIWVREGTPPLREAIDFAQTRGFDISLETSREINAQLVDEADLILVMTSGQKEAIANEFTNSAGKLALLSEITSGQTFDIPDPVTSPEEDTNLVADEICGLLKTGAPGILARVGVKPTAAIATPLTGTTVVAHDDTPGGSGYKKRRWWILVFILLLLFGAVYYFWTNPILGRQLPKFTGEAIQTFTPQPAVQTALSGTQTANPDQSLANDHGQKEQATKVSRSDAVCGQTEPMIVLALGIDEVEQADVIRLVRIDFVERKVLVLSIPRDFWVPIPGLEQYDITQFRINAAYGYGQYFNGAGQGVVKFSETVYYNYGINFDRYGAVHFAVFEQMIDAIGGVDFYLDGPIGAYGGAGWYHMNGAEALLFARERQLDLDAYRIQRQSVIIDAFIDKLRTAESLKKIPALGAQIIKDNGVVTDFTLRDVYTFLCFVQELNEGSLVFKDMPVDTYTPMITNQGRYIKVPKPEATTYIQDLILYGNY